MELVGFARFRLERMVTTNSPHGHPLATNSYNLVFTIQGTAIKARWPSLNMNNVAAMTPGIAGANQVVMTSSGDLISSELEKLVELKHKGVLSEEEFQLAKAKILK
jgi:hypothetical protein